MRKHRPDIDGLRALAVLPVLLFHAHLKCRGGFVGVDIFFVISGFLISRLILAEIKENTFSLANFWERRIRRIFPALIVVLLATLAAGWIIYLPADFESLGQSVLAQAGLVQNVFFLNHLGYFDAGTDTLPLLHTWSLAVEEQFYLLFPPLLWLGTRFKRFSVVPAIAVLAAMSFFLSVLGTYREPSAAFYLLPSRAWELLTGALLAASPGMTIRSRWLKEAAGLSGLALILFAIFAFTENTRFPGVAAIPPCLGAALIILSGDTNPTLVGRMLEWRPVVFVGLISYSLYLWHWPLLAFTTYLSLAKPAVPWRVALVVASFVPAVLSWKFVETPFRKRSICSRRSQVFALAGFSMLLMLVLGGGISLRHGIPSRMPPQAVGYADSRSHFAFRNQITAQEAATGQFAELGGQGTNQPVELLLWGDSHAQALAPVLDELCRRFYVRGVEATHSATAPLVGYANQEPHSLLEESPAFTKSVLEYIARKHVKMVILAAFWNSYRSPDSVKACLVATVRAIQDAGAEVFVVKDPPIPLFDVPRHAALTVFHHGNLDDLAISPEKCMAVEAAYKEVFDRISKMGATVLDAPRYFLNKNGRYDVVRNNKALYYDWEHLSIEGSELLEPMFEPLFHQIKSSIIKSPAHAGESAGSAAPHAILPTDGKKLSPENISNYGRATN